MSGLNGLGCEIAKNVLLGGVKSMTIQDTKETTLWDLSAQYYLGEMDVGECQRFPPPVFTLAGLSLLLVMTAPLTHAYARPHRHRPADDARA